MVALMQHQQDAVDKMHNGCILTGGVGSGKTLTSLSYYITKVCKGVLNDPGSMRDPKDVIVITTAKKRDSLDWEGDAAKLGVGADRTILNGGVCIRVDSWNNIARYEGVENAFFVFDEQRLVGSGAWTKSFLKIAKQNEWILLSATPGDTWLDYIPVFIANGFYKNRTDFKRTHVVYSAYSKFPKVEKYTEVNRLVRNRNRILVQMPFERHTRRHLVDVKVGYDKELYDDSVKRRWDPYESTPMKDVAHLFRVMRRVSNDSVDRSKKFMDLVRGKHDKLIVFYNFNYELDALRAILTFEDVPFAEWNGQNHDEIPDGDRWVYLVQYVAGAEGWNCVTTNAVCFYSLTYSYKIFEQAMGRIDRLNTPFVDLYYYILKSDSSMDRMIWKSLKGKKSFNEADYARNEPKIA